MKNLLSGLSLLVIVAGVAVLAPLSSSAAPAALPDVSDFSQYLLAEEDLLPLCEWSQEGKVVRPVRLGIMAYTLFSCGTDPNVRKVHNLVIFTPRVLAAGEGIIFMGMVDAGCDYPSEVGDWSQCVNTIFDNRALSFTKGGTWVYVGPVGYSDYQSVLDLGELAAGKPPAVQVPLILPQLDSNRPIESVAEGFFIEQPALVFHDERTYGVEDTLVIADGQPGQVSFRVQYAEPHDTLLTIFRQEDGRLVHSHEFSQQTLIDISLLDSQHHSNSILKYVDMANGYFFRDGSFVFQLQVDGVLLEERMFETSMR